MTAFLLDTHAVIWAINQSDRLSEAARNAIVDPGNRLLVSAATAWELATKHRLGRLPEAEALLATFEQQVKQLGAEPVDVTTTDALLAGRLDWEHRDPFDRMLAAQALVRGCVLVTADPAFSGFGVVRTLW